MSAHYDKEKASNDLYDYPLQIMRALQETVEVEVV